MRGRICSGVSYTDGRQRIDRHAVGLVQVNSTTTEKLKVFISYSHRDSADFADELVAGLELAGFEPFLLEL
jgi:phosphomannomutase